MLTEIPQDAILYILGLLDIQSLGRIACVCKSLNKHASASSVWKTHAKCQLISQKGDYLHLKELCKISGRWCRGQGKIKTAQKFGKNFMPWIQLKSETESSLFVSVGGKITNWDLNNSELKQIYFKQIFKEVDVTAFRVKQNLMSAVGWQGMISWCKLSDKTSAVIKERQAHTSDVNTVDHNKQVLISGGRRGMLKTFQWQNNFEDVTEMYSCVFDDDILSLQINDCLNAAAIGTGCKNNCSPLYLLDIERHVTSDFDIPHVNGAGILDMLWTSPHTLLTSSYDTYIRMWDVRAGKSECVRSWEEPHDNAVYSIDACGNAIASGSCRHGLVRVWDKRMRNSLQSFYLSGRTSSPVYSLKITSSKIFLALASQFRYIDFAVS